MVRQAASRLLKLHTDIKDRAPAWNVPPVDFCVTMFDVESLVTLQLYHRAVMPERDAGIWGDASSGQVNQ